MIFTRTPKSIRSLLLTGLVTTLLMGPASAAFGIQIPSPGSEMFLQTSGPNAGISIGDYYTSPAGGDTDHVFILRVPSDWPAGVPVTVALYDPELSGPDPASPRAFDEIRNGADTATFRLESPSGSTVASATYADSSTNGLWVELATFDPGVTGTGTYELHVVVSDDDDNSWRVDASHDPDCVAGGTCAWALLDNGNEVDVAPGGSAALALGVVRTSYQHDGGGGSVCIDHAFFVGPATPRPLVAHNFDMDSSGSVTYTSPGGGSVVGTVSGNGRWNGSVDATRVGDVLPDANGWWIADVCISRGNQYVFEAPGAARYHSVPPTPRLTVVKDDGVANAEVGDTLTYAISVTNASDGDTYPGSAYNVSVSDTLPSGTTYVSCDAPAGVACSETGGIVSATVSDPMLPGASFSFDVTLTVDPGVEPVLTNLAVVSYQDSLDNVFPVAEASDSDTIDFAPVLVVTAIGTTQMLRGETASLTFTVNHDPSSDGSPIFSPAVVCDICDSVSYDSGDTNSDGVLDFGESWIYTATAPSDGSSPDPLLATIDASGEDRAGSPLSADTNHETALVDPGTIAGNVFLDLNGNGLRDVGELGLDGVDLDLSDGGGPVDATSTTLGDYLFDQLYPNAYEVSIDGSTVPAGLVPTTSDVASVNLTEGAAVSGIDFGYALRVNISGTVFGDNDFDTIMGPGETGLGGMVVMLHNSGGTPIASTTSAPDGTYTFQTMPGVYSVSVGSGLPVGWEWTTFASVDLSQVLSGESVDGIDFGAGNHAPVLIGDYQLVDFGALPDALSATDPEGGVVTYTLVGGRLPTGLTLNSDGTFSGQSLESGVFDLVIEVCDDAAPPACAEFAYQLEVVAETIVDDGTVEPVTPVTPTSPVAETTTGSEFLPFTGFEAGSMLAIGVGLLFVGYILLSGAGFQGLAPEEDD